MPTKDTNPNHFPTLPWCRSLNGHYMHYCHVFPTSLPIPAFQCDPLRMSLKPHHPFTQHPSVAPTWHFNGFCGIPWSPHHSLPNFSSISSDTGSLCSSHRPPCYICLRRRKWKCGENVGIMTNKVKSNRKSERGRQQTSHSGLYQTWETCMINLVPLPKSLFPKLYLAKCFSPPNLAHPSSLMQPPLSSDTTSPLPLFASLFSHRSCCPPYLFCHLPLLFELPSPLLALPHSPRTRSAWLLTESLVFREGSCAQ